MTLRQRWETSGRLAFRLPSGFIVIGTWPSITDLARRGVLPFRLRAAILESAGKPLGEVTQDDISARLEQRQRVAAAFVRSIFDDETGQEEPTTLSFDELVDGGLPGDDVEALDTFVTLALAGDAGTAALRVNEIVERNLFDDAAAVEEAAGDSLEDLATFRDERRGAGRDPERADLADAPEPAAADQQPAARVSRRRRTEPPAPD